MQYVFFLGSNPALSATECLRALHAEGYKTKVTLKDERLLSITVAEKLPDNFLTRLGGCDRIGEVLAQGSKLWTAPELLTLLSPLPKKLKLGISVVNTDISIVKNLSFELKKLAREQSSRLVFILPINGKSQLNTAQVLFNKMDRQPNMELTICKTGEQWLLIRTNQVQDIPAYEHRDTSRPARDGVVGMLPPKLAQIMINLAVSKKDSDTPLSVYDPFCGAGTILQEGWLMGHKTTGSDNNEKMIAASTTNLDWLANSYAVDPELRPTVFVHDILTALPAELEQSFDAIVSEPYLGKALRTPLSTEEANQAFAELMPIYRDFFTNIAPAIKIGGTVIFLFPAFRQIGYKASFTPFPAAFLDEIGRLGYCQRALIPEEIADFYQGTDRGTIMYSRPDALVGREITLWEKVTL